MQKKIILFLILFPCLAYASLVSWWQAEGNALDSSGSNDGTLVNSVGFATGKIGKAFSLSGGFVRFADNASLDITGQMTISAWIKPNATNANRIVDKITAGGGDGYLLDLLGGKLRMIAHGGAASSSVSISTGVFSHVAGVYDGSIIKVYVNGVLEGSSNFIGNTLGNAHPLRIGVDSTESANFFSGLIDDVHIYNHALSSTEIQNMALLITVPEPASMILLIIALFILKKTKF